MSAPPALIVAGMPRTGTSWLARALSFADGYSYCREPDNPAGVRGASPRFEFLYLCADVLPRFRTLYAALGLAWNDRVEQFLVASNRAGDRGTYTLQREARAQIDGWTTEVAAADVAACRRFSEPFEIATYPDFGTEPIEPDLARAGPPFTPGPPRQDAQVT